MFYDPCPRESIDFVATQGYLETPGVLAYPPLFMLPAAQGGIFNWSEYDNPEVTADLLAARTTPDAPSAAESFVAAQEIFAPDLLQITLAGSYQHDLPQQGAHGVTTSVAAYASPWALHLGGE